MKVNFTMLVRNRARLTKQALESLAAAGTEALTVTIMDDRSEEETADVLAAWADAHESVLVRNVKPRGTGELRNHAVYASIAGYGRGDFLYLSDNDVFFKKGWLEALTRAFEVVEPQGFRVIGAYNHPFHQPVVTVPAGRFDVCEVNALASQSMLMRWETWVKYGPFCQTPVDAVCQSEDVDFTNRIKADGGRIGVVSPALIVNTGITNSFGARIPGWEQVLAEAPKGVYVE